MIRFTASRRHGVVQIYIDPHMLSCFTERAIFLLQKLINKGFHAINFMEKIEYFTLYVDNYLAILSISYQDGVSRVWNKSKREPLCIGGDNSSQTIVTVNKMTLVFFHLFSSFN